MDKKLKRAYIISWFLAPAIILTCTETVFNYSFWIKLYGTKWFFEIPYHLQAGNLVKVMILIFIVFLFYAIRSSVYARLVCLGFLLNFMYIFILYFQAIYYNKGSLFPIVYGFLFIITVIAFVDGIRSLNPETIAECFSNKTPRKITATFFTLSILVVLFMLFFWALKPILWGVSITNYYITLIVLSVLIIIPFYLVAIYMLIMNRHLGYILSPILLVWGSIPIMHFIAFKSADDFWSFIYLIYPSFLKDLFKYSNDFSQYTDYKIVSLTWFIASILIIIHPFVSFYLSLFFLSYFKNPKNIEER